jgi:poly(A) polymerase
MTQRIISEDGPSEVERLHNATLEAWVKATLEPIDESESRRRAVEQISAVCKAWIRYTMITDFNLPSSEDYGGRIFTTGSYRHNVHSSGSDIDMVLIAPRRITRQHFFSTLVEQLRNQRGVTDLIFAEEAIVPIISFKFEGVDIDLSFVAIQSDNVPDTINMLDDRIHIGLDDIAVKSVNGVRDAQLLIDSVPNTQVFRQALRFIKHWGKRRGIYGAKLGHTSGIGWAIMVAKVCQCYPNLNGAGLILRFFRFYRSWVRKDPTASNPNNPIFLSKSLTPDTVIPGIPKSWNAKTNARDAQAMYPIITPAYPYQNSCYSVSRTTLDTICDEFARAHDILMKHMEAESQHAPLLAKAADAQLKRQQQIANTSTPTKAPAGMADLGIPGLPDYAEQYPYGVWSRVMEPVDLFGTYTYFLHVAVSATDFKEYDTWVDFVESKIRFLWTEGPRNRGACFECYPQVRIRVVTRRFEEPAQVEILAKLKAAAKTAAARRAAIGGSGSMQNVNVVSNATVELGALSPMATTAQLGASPDPRLSAGSPAGNKYGAVPASAQQLQEKLPSLFTCHFYFGISMDSGKDAQGRPVPAARAPNLPEIIKAFHGICADKMSAGTKLPVVDIVRQSALPAWLPGLPKPVTDTTNPGEGAGPASNGSSRPITPPPNVRPTPTAVASGAAAAALKRPRDDAAATTANPVKPSQPTPIAAAHSTPGHNGAAASAVATDADELLGLDF